MKIENNPTALSPKMHFLSVLIISDYVAMETAIFGERKQEKIRSLEQAYKIRLCVT